MAIAGDCNSPPSGSKVRVLSPPQIKFESFEVEELEDFLSSQLASKLLNSSHAGVAQLVERQPSKLHVASSTLVSRSIEAKICSYSSVVEHSLGKGEVSSSNLDKSSRYTV